MRITSTWLFVLISVLALSACQRSVGIGATAIVQHESPVVSEPTENHAQGQIGATQTELAMPTATISMPATATKEPATAVTPAEIVATITPTIPVTPTIEEIMVPTLKKPFAYDLKEHENTYCIARRYNVDIGELLSINNLTTASQPEVGTSIKLPSTGHRWSSGPKALYPHPTQYTVKNGDTLNSIACLFGDVSPEAIIFVNKLAEPVTLTVGSIIDIP